VQTSTEVKDLKQGTSDGSYTNLLTDEEKWHAVLRRRRTSDGRFVFAVRSTGIYWNPSCPGKRPKRTQILFFPAPAGAEVSGFRPCRRCRPHESPVSPQLVMINRLCTYIEEKLNKKMTLSTLASQAGISPYHLQRTFKKIVGVSPRRYIEALRLAKMKRSLVNGETVTRAIYNAGFSSRSRFYESGSHRFGMSPGILRRGGAGVRISYTIVSCPLGRLLVAGTTLGICSVCIGDSDTSIERALAEEYPAARIERDDQALSKWVGQISKYFTGQETKIDVPLDVQATAFQWQVWAEIKSIPYGGTMSYSGIASALGKPQAARAVARACATNPVALIVPCHRVVGEDGKLHGYRWGMNRKRQLLRLERDPTENQR